MFVVQNVTWSVASASHRFGSAPFDTGDESRNNACIALLSFGSGYQNNHHAFPHSAQLGLRWWEPDVGAWAIRALARAGLARDLKRVPASEVAARLRTGSRARRPSAEPAGHARPSRVNQHPDVVAAHRRSSLVMAAAGLAGVLAAPFHVSWLGFTPLDGALLAGMYWLTLGPGLSVGFHRHFSHGSFRASRPVRWCLAVLGSMGGQGPLTYWVAIHRRHHERSDAQGDPHSPHLSGAGRGAGLRGLWHAHFAWSLAQGMPSAAHYCPDLLREPWLLAVSRSYRRWVLAGLLLPALVGLAVSGTWQGALGGLLWGGLVRLFLTSNLTWSLNSICHSFGSRPFLPGDRSTNNAWLSLPTLGESWHNNHHAQPSSAAHGFAWWQLDLNYLFIRLLEVLGLATDVKRPAAVRAELRHLERSASRKDSSRC
jgi:stearoyl-CoA desaturase (delta-9 desaturase)